MKHRIISLLVLLCIATTLLPGAQSASGVVKLPSKLKIIGAESFMNDGSIREVIIPDGVQRIDEFAFAGSGLKKAHIPASVTQISATSFASCPGLVVYGTAGSYVEEWCDWNDVTFVDENGSTPSQDLDPAHVQDLRFFSTLLNYGDATVYSDHVLIPFNGNNANRSVLDTYVARLTDGKHNFKLNGKYVSANGNFGSWVLGYTGTASTGEPLKQMYVNDCYGELSLYYAVDGSSFKGQLSIVTGLSFKDLGMRASGGDVTLSRIGTSSRASLVQSGNTYSTSDGRFSVRAGQAQLYRDGTKYTTTGVALTRSESGGQDKFLINDYYRNECLALTLPMNYEASGDEYDAEQLGLSASTRYSISSQTGFFAYTWQWALGAGHDGSFMMLHYPPANTFRNALVRVLKWDRSADIAVIYIAAAFDTAPKEVECLFAVKLSGATDGDDTSQHLYLQRGGSLSVTFGNTYFDALSENFSWEVISGGNCVSLNSTVGKTIGVTGLAIGTARIRCTYQYSYYTTPPLGTSRYYGFDARSQDYVITVY